MKLSRLNMPAVWAGSSDESDSSLVREGLRTGNLVAKGVFGVDVILNLSFSGNNDIVVALLEFPNSNG
jgi:hypothetical protein